MYVQIGYKDSRNIHIVCRDYLN